MSVAPAFLPIGPLPSPAMDYALLRREGVQLLERLAAQQWTDYNTHDPGITILEQLCYALTDLGYRIQHPMADLLARRDPRDLPGPVAILTTDPVTGDDLRRLALTVPGVDNAWVEAAAPALDFYYHATLQELRFEPNAPDAVPLRIAGLHRVLVQVAPDQSGELVVKQVERLLHQHRLLNDDFEVVLVGVQTIGLRAVLEVGPVENPEGTLAEVIDRIERYLAAPARFETLAEAQARGLGVDEILEGPARELESELVAELPPPRSRIFESDLVREMLDVSAVRAVRRLEIAASPSSRRQRWGLSLRAGQIAAPPDLTAGVALPTSLVGLELQRGGHVLTVDQSKVRARLTELRAARRAAAMDMRGLDAPVGRDRKLGNYSSVLRQFPEAYGLHPLGLPASASAQRRAQALQLEAYLQIFDQLLANAFAQLEHAHELFSAQSAAPRTYFSQLVEDLAPGEAGVLTTGRPEHETWLAQQVEPGDALERRKRFLAHGLARFAEQLGSPGASADAQIIAQRQEFLSRYPSLSRGRGTGIDVADASQTSSPFEERVRLKLGLPGQRFMVVEHVLLRPLEEDVAQRSAEGERVVPLLTHAPESSPWSSRISFVFEDTATSVAEHEERQRWISDVVLDETPAHLRPEVAWFDTPDYEALLAAWQAHRQAASAYRAQLSPTSRPATLVQLRARDARDRALDLLSFEEGSRRVGPGETFPLVDIPLSENLVVAPGRRALIRFDFSQRDVRYRLFVGATEAEDYTPLVGTGESLALETPAITMDVTFGIRAEKVADPSRWVWLKRSSRVQEGVDASLVGALFATGAGDELPPLTENPGEQARLTSYGERVEIRLSLSQEGVEYVVVDATDPTRVLSAPSVGTSGTIVLALRDAASEDLELRLRGRRELANPGDPLGTALLDQVLHLRVRANPDVPASLVSAIIEHGADALVRVSPAQLSASYQAFVAKVRSRDFVFRVPAPVDVISVDDAGRSIQLARPALAAPFGDPPGFASLGEPGAGASGNAELTLSAVDHDLLILVQASKLHATAVPGQEPRLVASAVQLRQALALLVRPDRTRDLRVEVAVVADASAGPWALRDGQPGVFYQLQSEGAALGRPGYFHQESDETPGFNKGVGELRVGQDFAVPRAAPNANVTTTPPALPLIAAPAVASGSIIRALARKSLSNLEAMLDRTATLAPAPTMHAEPASIGAGSSSSIVIEGSVLGASYRLIVNGIPSADSWPGTGDTLSIDSGPLPAGALVDVLVEPDDTGLSLAYRARVDLLVEP